MKIAIKTTLLTKWNMDINARQMNYNFGAKYILKNGTRNMIVLKQKNAKIIPDFGVLGIRIFIEIISFQPCFLA
jgi:hypothetical protein